MQRQRGAGEPGAKPHQVHRRGRDHMLQLGLGQPDIAGAAQSLRPNPGRDCSFNAGPPSVLLGKAASPSRARAASSVSCSARGRSMSSRRSAWVHRAFSAQG